jgi:hypothetical protein
MASIDREPSGSLLDELLALTSEDRTDLAIRLVELNALHTEGEITTEQFAARRAEIYATASA